MEEPFIPEPEKAPSRDIHPSVGKAGKRVNPEEPAGPPLPELDPLVERIPAPVRDRLEKLYMGRFIGVKRIRKEDLY